MKPDKDNSQAAKKDQAPRRSSTKPDTRGVDAREHPEKLKENRERLDVDEEHKTPDMNEHHRGTFP